jgi:DNA-binding GntR family transcriptional regulator
VAEVILESRDYRTKSQVAAEKLRTAIRQGDIRPGSRLDIDALVQLLGMSTTPIREALRSLEAEGLLVSQPHKGVRVAEFSPEDAAALYDLRALLESHAIRIAVPNLTENDFARLDSLLDEEVLHIEAGDKLAASQANQQWHEVIYSRASGTPYLLEFISRMWNVFPWSTTWDVDGRFKRSIDDHKEIMSALRAHDADRAEALLRVHILHGKDLVVELLRKRQDSETDA